MRARRRSMLMTKTKKKRRAECKSKFCRGRILWFNPRSGRGCIVRDDDQGDCFVHANALCEPLQRFQGGDVVAFEVDKTGRSPKAVNVRLIKR